LTSLELKRGLTIIRAGFIRKDATSDHLHAECNRDFYCDRYCRNVLFLL